MMNITPLIPDGYIGPIKRLNCRVCGHTFYITQADYDAMQEVRYCHECSMILASEVGKAQATKAPAHKQEMRQSLPSSSQLTRVSRPRTIDRDKMTVEQLLEEARAHYKAWHYTETIASYTQAIQKDPTCAAASRGKATALRLMHREKEAREADEQARRLDPANAIPSESSSSPYDLSYAQGQKLLKNHDYEGAWLA